MKRILILVFVLVVSGCKDKDIGIEKKAINKAFSDCKGRLTGALKSPSSLKLSLVEIEQIKPSLPEIYNSFGKDIISDNKILELNKREKTRFRTLFVKVDYEAKNSFGVVLKDAYTCNYIYKVDSSNLSPKSLYLTKIKSNVMEEYPYENIVNIDSESSIFLIKEISSISKSLDNNFNNNDGAVFNELIEFDRITKNNDEAERLRQSWRNFSSNEFEGANLSGV